MQVAIRPGVLASSLALATVGLALMSSGAWAATSSHYGFNGPTGVAVQGQHVWVTNANANSVTELSATDGSLVRVVSLGDATQTVEPMGVAADNSDVWVAGLGNSSVTELNATDGSIVRTLSSGGLNGPVDVAVGGSTVWTANQTHLEDPAGATIPFSTSITRFNAVTGALEGQISGSTVNGLNGTDAVAFGGANVWVANANSNVVTEFHAATGSLVRVVRGDGINSPQSVVVSGSHVWIANQDGNSLTELNASTGSLVRIVSGGAYGFDGPSYLAANTAHVWVTNPFADSVTELNASTGSLVRVIRAGADRLRAPMGIAVGGAHVWVANQWGDSVTELNASTGTLVRVIH